MTGLPAFQDVSMSIKSSDLTRITWADLNPYVARGMPWRQGGEVVLPALGNRCQALDRYGILLDGSFNLDEWMIDIAKDFPRVRTNYCAQVCEQYAELLLGTPPEPSDGLLRGAVFTALVNYHAYGTAVLVPILEPITNRLRIEAVLPRNYWRNEIGDQFAVIRRDAERADLMHWSRERKELRARTARLKSSQIVSLTMWTTWRLPDDVDDAMVVFPRISTDSDFGVSLLPQIAEKVFAISAINTVVSYVAGRHGNPFLLLMSEEPSLGMPASPAEQEQPAEPEWSLSRALANARDRGTIALPVDQYKDARYLTWDAHIPELLQHKKQLEEEIASDSGLPANFFAAEGRIASGSALSRVYVSARARVSSIQQQWLPGIQIVAALANFVAGEMRVPIPQDWTNVFEEMGTGTVVDPRQQGMASAEGEDRQGPEPEGA